jgi:hypothetical protein
MRGFQNVVDRKLSVIKAHAYISFFLCTHIIHPQNSAMCCGNGLYKVSFAAIQRVFTDNTSVARFKVFKRQRFKQRSSKLLHSAAR